MNRSSWIAALATTGMLAASLPASAQVARFDPSLKNGASPLLTDVQFRGGGVRRFHGGGFRGGGFHGGGFGNRGFGYRGGYRGGGRGAAIGAGVAGLAAGALLGGALASQSGPAYGYDGGYGGYGYGAPAYGYGTGYGVNPGYAVDPGYAVAAPPAQEADASGYCAQRFKSYDPASGTYLGYDGQRHPCP